MSEDVELSGISMRFGRFRAVDNVDVTVKAGEFFSFLGPSGCGKTTILRMISGFTQPSSGTIRIGGRDMQGISPNERPTALIFQNLALFPLMPVWENIAFGLEVRGVPKAQRRGKAEELLRLVDLHGAADKRVSQMSGGQRQRVAIARALAVEPKVMLLDEPLSALDLKLRMHMRGELRAIQRRTNITFIYITHDQSEALAMSDRIAVMSQGVLQQVGTPTEIYNAPANGFVASFVGENNVLPGVVTGMGNGMAKFRTAQGTFAARPGPGVGHHAQARLYIRPEHARLEAAPSPELNSLPVEVLELTFEGSVVNVHTRDARDATQIVQVRNDPGVMLPRPGERLHFNFNPDRAVILNDAAAGTRG